MMLFQNICIAFDQFCLLSWWIPCIMLRTFDWLWQNCYQTSAIFIFFEKRIFWNPSWTRGLIFTKFNSDHIQTMLAKCYWFCFDNFNLIFHMNEWIWWYDVKLHQLYLFKALIYWHQTLCHGYLAISTPHQFVSSHQLSKIINN